MTDTLRRLARAGGAPHGAAPGDPARCELCSEPIGDEHRHLVNVETRSLSCSCRGCALLFERPGSGAGRFRTVPERFVRLPAGEPDRQRWASLGVPVTVAFVFRNSHRGAPAAFYPSPAGATESLLDPEAWGALVDSVPVLAGMQDDTEALLVRAVDQDLDAYLVPIDTCYELVGLLRRVWRGFDGGGEAHAGIDAFFARLSARADDPGGGRA